MGTKYTGSNPVLATKNKIKRKKMKNYLINAAIWYVILSLGMFVMFILFNLTGHLGIRLILALIFAYIKPLYGMPWRNTD